MKRMVFGALVTLIGFVFSAFCFIYAVMNPGTYNGTGGLLGSFLCQDILGAFIVSTVIMCVGLVFCGWEAFRKDR